MSLALFQAYDGSNYDNLVLLSGRWYNLQGEKLQGSISSENAETRENQIRLTAKHYATHIKPHWEIDYDLKVIETPIATPPNGADKNGDTSTKIILCLSANPSNSDRLASDIEIRDIENILRKGSGRDNFILVPKGAVTVGDFRQAVLDHKPDIIHFSGHGTETGEIILHNSSDKSQNVSAQALGNFFKIIAKIAGVECVVLSACYSEIQAKEISKHVPFVMGMRSAVPDKTAINFSVTLYQVLVDGHGYELAFDFAKNDLELKGLTGKDLPILLKDNVA